MAITTSNPSPPKLLSILPSSSSSSSTLSSSPTDSSEFYDTRSSFTSGTSSELDAQIIIPPDFSCTTTIRPHRKDTRALARQTSQAFSHVKTSMSGIIRVQAVAVLRMLKSRPWTRSSKRNTAKDCPFVNLPAEILQQIYDYLPLQSRAALALANKSLSYVVGNLAWKTLTYPNETRNRMDFLASLERDTCAEIWLCPSCGVLRPKAPFLSKVWFYTRCGSHCNYSHFDYCSRRLEWGHVYLIMQRHRRGENFGIPVEALSERGHITEYYRAGRLKEISLQGKVVEDELFIKASIIFHASTNPEESWLNICDHLRLPRMRYLSEDDLDKEEFSRILPCRLSHLGSPQRFCADCVPRLRRCAYCAIEYDFAAVQASGRPQLYLEVWANLGKGESPEDPKWTNPRNGQFAQPLHFELGSIRAKYVRG